MAVGRYERGHGECRHGLTGSKTSMNQSTAKAVIATEIAGRLRALPSHNAQALRQVRREVSRALKGEAGTAIIDLACQLLETKAPGAHVVAYELILYHPTAPSKVRSTHLKRLGATLTSWGAVDVFACYVAGRAWRADQISDGVIGRWARSSDRWWRRAALVSTVPLNVKAQGGWGDADAR